MADILIRNLTKKFGSTTVIENMNLTIENGLFTVLVGPSGCGKTTLLRMIAGIEPVSAGQIFIDGKNVTDIPPAKRGVAMVFQNYAIYPTMSVRENIEFGLRNNKVPKAEREAIIQEVCSIVGLTDYLQRKPSQLSGGQRQRVALARAMVKKPQIFLMDEPLSNLDAKLRGQMRIELKELHKSLGTTFIYVTHDQVEAMSMADTIVLLENGEIRQEAPPAVMYHNPMHIFTARFIGTPPMNLIKTDDEGLMYGFRPEKIRFGTEKTGDLISVQARVVTSEMLGSETHYQIDTVLGRLMVKSPTPAEELPEGTLYASVPLQDIYFFAGEGYRIQPYFNNWEEYLARFVRCIDEASR